MGGKPGWLCGVGFDLIANIKERGLRFSVLTQFFQLAQARFGLLFFALKSPLSFVALFLLARLLFLALVESGTVSWHRTPSFLFLCSARPRRALQQTLARPTTEALGVDANGLDSRRDHL